MEPTFTGIKNIGYLKTSFDHAAMSIIKDTDKGWQRISRSQGPIWGLRKVIF